MASRIQHTGIVCAIAGFLFVGFGPPESASGASKQATSADTTFSAFEQAVARHVALHAGLRREVPGPVAHSSAAQVSDASDILAAAIERARPRARQGDFFDPSTTQRIRQRIGDELRSPASAVVIATIDDEQRSFRHPRIHLRFPIAAEMATMPASLLRLLPALPAELEYRIVGEYLVLRDVKAALVLDYIPEAIPRRAR